MNKRLAFMAAATLCAVTVTWADAAEKFQKLSGAQIRARLAGMEITDETHWADVLRPMALSRAIPWLVRATANGACRRMNCASIAARMTVAVTRYGLRGRK